MKQNTSYFILFALLLGGVQLLGQSGFRLETEVGNAVYYADYLEGQATALGEYYRKDQFTCAHRTHPKGTLLKVTRLDNGRSVVVRVNDRGPYSRNTLIDISRAAAEQIDLIRAGRAKVRVEVVGRSNTNPNSRPESYSDRTVTRRGAPQNTPSSTPRTNDLTFRSGSQVINLTDPNNRSSQSDSRTYSNNNPSSYDYPANRNEVPRSYDYPATTRNTPRSYDYTRKGGDIPQSYSSSRNRSSSRDLTRKSTPRDLTVQRLPANQDGYAIQIASYRDAGNASRRVLRLKQQGLNGVYLKQDEGRNGGTLNRVVIGPFTTDYKAKEYLRAMRSRFDLDGIVIKL